MKGIGASPGISIGRAFVISKKDYTLTGTLLTDDAGITAEIARFDRAVTLAANEIETIMETKTAVLTADELGILEAQFELINDPQLREDTIEKISAEKKNAGDALMEVINNFVDVFQSMDDEYMRARSADIADIGNRILNHLSGTGSATGQKFAANTIIVGGDISPSDTISMDISCVIGFATVTGSKTSHAAIIAKSKGIPAVVGCGNSLMDVKNGDLLIIDGTTGLLHVNPTQAIIAEYQVKSETFTNKAEGLRKLKDTEAITTDGIKITLTGNIAAAADLDDVFNNGGEGAGLLRTEMLFMNRSSLPTEEEQFEFYKAIAIKAGAAPVIVRTIDIGGDKQAPCFNLPVEQNPFLGYRAIRICLDREDIFITQLKAILRASAHGNLKIMFPMISNIQELRQAKGVLADAKAELTRDNIPFNGSIQTGIMIEVPSAAITADMLAKESDFFSIGTNDLCQYTLAVDRMNEKITHLYDPFNPGVLRLIAYVIEQAKKHHIHAGMCGEMAGDPVAALLLVGMGLRDFSMSASSIPAVKNIIIGNSLSSAEEVWKNVREMDNSDTIKAYLHQLTS